MKQNQFEQNLEKQISFQFEDSFILEKKASLKFSTEAAEQVAMKIFKVASGVEGSQKGGSFQKPCVETDSQANSASLNQASSAADQIESVLDNGTSKIFKQSHLTQTDLDRKNRVFQLAHDIQIEKASQNNILDFSISEPKKTQDFKNQNSSKTQDLPLKPFDQSSSSSDDLTRKSLAQLSGEAVLQSFHKIVQSERKIMHLVLLHIQEIDSRKLYLAHASSLFEYLTQIAGYAEGAAYDRIQAARLLNKHPQIVQKIEDGAINLSQLVQLSSCLKKESKEGRSVSFEITHQILEKVQKKSLFETKKILSQEFHLTPCYVQKITPQRDESVQMQITLSQDQYAILQKAMSLISHSVPDKSLAEGIAYLAKVYVQKIEGKTQKPESLASIDLKEERSQVNQKFINHEQAAFTDLNSPPAKGQSSAKSLTQSFWNNPFHKIPRAYICVRTKRKIYARAQNCCQYINPKSQQKCSSRYQLQIDHITPLALGGDNSLKNLRLLCAAHNRSEAVRLGL